MCIRDSLSTLPPASPSLPSAVGHSSVAVGSGNNTKRQTAVNAFLKKKTKNMTFFQPGRSKLAAMPNERPSLAKRCSKPQSMRDAGLVPYFGSTPAEAPCKLERYQQRKKKQRFPSAFYSSLSGVQTGIPSGPSGGIPSPSVGSELRLCRPFATLFYLSTLPPASPSLPSAVGHSSVAVGIGNITKRKRAVNTFFKKKVSAKAIEPAR